MSDAQADVVELLDEVFADLAADTSLSLAELEPAQIEAWVSNLLAAWRSDLVVPDPTAADRDLLARCVAAETTDALLICRAVATLAPVSVPDAAEAIAALQAAGADDSEVGRAIGGEQVTGAWLVEPVDGPTRGREAAVIVGFIHPDSSEHVLLADLVLGDDDVERLAGLRLDGPPDGVIGSAFDDELLEEHEDGDEPELALATTSIEPATALRRVAGAWEAANNAMPEIEDDALDLLLVNQLVVAARLRTALGAGAPSFLVEIDQRPLLGIAEQPQPAIDAAPEPAPLDAETATANAASLRTFQAALRSHAADSAPADLVDVVSATISGSVAGLAADEAEAVGFLEWADWLGALIGLVRAGPETTVTPSSLVDLINRCPEVSSSIPKADRGYVEFAFSVVLDVWGQAGVVADGQLTTDGYRALYPAVVQAWSRS